ncbi:DUF2894 domain-containing protein [Marinobacter persicus]|uniref:DUF2894 family protein n=1 Tax=Marinobacter persicus TaxID=930118 RepID=A0A2S6G501_9GAMM|nr:DUF2894 domain-containing protein [Marinobacter persicus]PPK50867.1 Protein of unknown function (DUF2894) [Marinobacter persicus]PPK54181.1 Protein of unknown function (DUF2894) [Marinobacter persicus]PPK57457.1 Protein of unknown function (DUF2894) [Marinobacter persicus]
MPGAITSTSDLSLLRHLRETCADRADPVRFRYLESLEQRLRARGLQGSVHWQKLEQAVSDYHARYDQPEPEPQLAETDKPSLLAVLTEQLNQVQASAPTDNRCSALEQLIFGPTENEPTPGNGELAAQHPQPLRAMARAQADRGSEVRKARIRHAIEQTPEDAGPMNAHRLVSRAIARMQSLSPEYLDRFARYADTLMALEQLARKN